MVTRSVVKRSASRLGEAITRALASVTDWRNVVEVVAYAALALILMWPVTVHLNSRMVGTGDGEFYAWLGWRLAELVRDGEFPMMIPDAVYPETYNVALGDGYGAYLVMAAWNLVVNPYLAINLTVFSAFVLNFLAGRRLGRIVAPDRRAVWIITAVAVGTAPPLLLRAYGHYHLCFAFAAALILAEGILYAKNGRPLRVGRVGAILAVAFGLSVYWFVSSLVALVVVVGIAALCKRQILRVSARLVSVFLLAMVVLLPLTVPRLAFQQRESNSSPPNSLQELDNANNSRNFSADLLSVVAQPSGSRIELPFADRLHRDFYPNRVESTVFPGLLLLGGLVGLAFVRSPLRLPVACAAVAVWVLSLGPALVVDGTTVEVRGRSLDILPMQILYQLPGTSSLRTPSRMAVALPVLAAVALAVVANEGLRRAPKRSVAVLAGVGSASILATNLIVLPYTPNELPAGMEAVLSEVRDSARPGDTMMEVPFDAGGQYIQTIRYQMTHELPMLGFHAQHSALPWYSGFKRYKSSLALAELRCFPPLIGYGPAPYPATLRRTGRELAVVRRDFGVRYLFVNRDLLEQPSCDARRVEITAIIHDARIIGSGQNWEIREIVRA